MVSVGNGVRRTTAGKGVSAAATRADSRTYAFGVDTPVGRVDGIFSCSAGGSADGAVADTAAGTAATQRVAFIFYRMCSVYRAEGGFASQGSLNPVRPWP